MPHRDLVIIPDDQPGVLARIGRALGDAGVNIEGVSAFTGQGKGIVHLLVDEPQKANQALAEAGFEVKAMRRVLVSDVADQPGALAELSQKLADAEVNIEQAYIATPGGGATPTRIVLVVDDVDKGKAALGMEPDDLSEEE